MPGVLAGRWGGVRLGAHWALLVLLAVAAGAGYGVHALILVGSLLAHELAHLLVAQILGVTVEEVLLTPLGGVARLDPALEYEPQAEFAVALAGPFQSFFLAGLAQALAGGRIWDPSLVQFCFQVNANLAFFNLLPALPLDGGRALRGVLGHRYGHAAVTRALAWSGRLTGLGLTAFAVAMLAAGRVYPAALVAGPYLTWLAGRAEDGALFRAMRSLLRKQRSYPHRRVMPVRALVALGDARLGEVLPHLAARPFHLVVVVDARLRPLGALTEAELSTAFERLGPEVSLAALLAPPAGPTPGIPPRSW